MNLSMISTGILAVIAIAQHGAERPVTSKALSDRLGWPARTAEPILQALVHDGILEGVRGPHGGYRLADGAWDRRIGEIGILAQRLSKTPADEARCSLVERAAEAFWADLHKTTIRAAVDAAKTPL
jgi:DNA-binding IscR family transcriptional regulator